MTGCRGTRTALGLVAVALAGTLADAAQEQAPPDPALVRVFVQAPDHGDAAELKARQESVKDLTAALTSKKKLLAVVTEQSRADVVIAIVERRVSIPRVVMGLGPRPGQPSQPGGNVTRNAELIVELSLEHGDEHAELKNQNKVTESGPGWKSAADDAAKQIEKWISERREKILALRR